MRLSKRKSIVLGIVSVFVILSIVFILKNPQTKGLETKLNHSEKVEDSKKVEYTLDGLPGDIVQYIESNRITSDLSTDEMEKKFEKYLYKDYTSWEEGLDKIPKDDESKAMESAPFFSPGKVFTYEEVKEDVNYLFTNLKYGYAGYQYFGGDEKI
ncbi:hypothetical protein [Anaerophilus nitritogenes]|uniref:hypothetical protein n=1 Tax=Anaerophilus nitritogenes TaxID=2498136 RepID=UPI00101DFBA2|nr:hypothetical protein [Anaerophilus nitritogenes]